MHFHFLCFFFIDSEMRFFFFFFKEKRSKGNQKNKHFTPLIELHKVNESKTKRKFEILNSDRKRSVRRNSFSCACKNACWFFSQQLKLRKRVMRSLQAKVKRALQKKKEYKIKKKKIELESINQSINDSFCTTKKLRCSTSFIFVLWWYTKIFYTSNDIQLETLILALRKFLTQLNGKCQLNLYNY